MMMDNEHGYGYNVGETTFVSNTHEVKVVKHLDCGWTQDPDNDYIVQTCDNLIEVYEVETVNDNETPSNNGIHDIMISDNGSTWLWGSREEADVALEHCRLLDDANISIKDIIDEVEDEDLKDYVREVWELAAGYDDEEDDDEEDSQD